MKMLRPVAPLAVVLSLLITSPAFLLDAYAADNDGDGMDDAWEISYFGGTNVTDGTGDFDGDRLKDLYEYQEGTHPKQIDTDTDGFTDYVEAINKICPTNASEYPVPPYKEWVIIHGGVAREEVYCTYVDDADNIYVSGYTWGPFDGQTHKGGKDMFLCKFNADGSNVWTVLEGGSGYDYGSKILVDDSGYIYFAGFSESTDFDGQTNAGTFDFCLLKYAPDGTKLWTKMWGSPSHDEGGSLQMDSQGYLYHSAHTQGDFDGQTNAGVNDIVVSKMNADGERLWTRYYSTPFNEAGGLKIGPDDEFYISGSTRGSMGGQTNVNEGTSDALLMRLDANWDVIWTRMWGSDTNDGCVLHIASDGSLFCSGTSLGSFDGCTNAGDYDIFLSRFDSDGNKLWTKMWGTPERQSAATMYIDHGIFISYQNTGDIDGQTSIGNADLCLSRLTKDGNRHWTRIWGSTQHDMPKGGGGQESSGKIYVGGTTQGSFDYAEPISPQGVGDICLTKWIVNRTPIADLQASPTNGTAPFEVTLDISDSSDPDNDIVGWQLDQDGDGHFDTSGEELGLVVVAYAEPGTYTPTVRVTDEFGSWDEDSASVTVWGNPPVAVIEADTTDGAAPLTVNFTASNSTAATSKEIVAYEWDMNGDGSYDLASSNDTASWVYRDLGERTAVLRVTDNEGRTDTASLQITVSSAMNPPEVSLTANPDTGKRPLTVVLAADATDDGSIVQYEWDLDGDGSVDLQTAESTVTNIYTLIGTLIASVRVIDDTGLDATANASIFVTQPANLSLWIMKPPKQNRIVSIWGDAVSVIGRVAPANEAVSVQFEYKLATSPTWQGIGAPVYPQRQTYETTWDVTGLADGSNYNMRAIAILASSQVATSDVYTVKIDSGSTKHPGKVVEGDVGGKHQKEETFSENEIAVVSVYDGTSVVVPFGAAESNITVEVELTGTNVHAASGSTKGKGNINANRNASIDGDPTLSKTIILDIPYPDDDDDGIVDGTSIRETSLEAHWFDASRGEWRRALSSEVHAEENFVRARNHHLTEFGIFGTRNLLAREMGGILLSGASAYSNTVHAANLTDGSLVSYWRSQENPSGNQEFIYNFTNSMGAIIDELAICNYGQAEQGKTNYSEGFSVLGSMNGTGYQLITNGILLQTETFQEFSIQSVTCRWVKLIITNGVNPSAWDLAEFAVYGMLTNDADADQMIDSWEMKYFGDFDQVATNDFDEDELTDLDESISGTDPTNAISFFKIDDSISPASNEIAIVWTSVSGRLYSISRGTNLLEGFSPLASNIVATPPSNIYTDRVENTDNAYYEIEVERE